MGRARLLEGGRGAENASVDGGEGLLDGDRVDLRHATSAAGVHRGRWHAGERR
jgi:hypothetical protein